MFSPTVIELHRPLEPVSRDTFLDVALPAASRELPDNVTLLRPAVVRSVGLTAA